MTPNSLSYLLVAAALAGQLAGCGRQPPRPEPPLRMVKLVTPAAASAADYRFTALVRQARRADLSFENSGRLASVAVDVGDTVSAGQLLATLDAEPARLQVLQAEAQVRSSAGQLQERRNQLRQQQAMHADGASSQLTLDTAQVALTMADATHSAASATLAQALRAQRLAVLRAPYAGRVKTRLADPGTLAAAGQAVLQIEGTGQPQVVADLPAALLPPSLKPGAVVAAYAQNRDPGTMAGSSASALTLTLRSLADHIDAGGTIQAIFDLQPGQTPPRSGEVLSIAIASGAPQTLALPLTAVALDKATGTGHVFVYHPKGNALERRPVTLGRQRADTIEVTQGLRAGEQVAGAGTAFLIDHQRVTPYQPTSALAAGEQP